MHILLTDILTCPRCGPTFGLILLADRFEDRHVATGRLGCANCRSSYPVDEGIGDLRTVSEGSLGISDRLPIPEDRAIRTAALLGAAPPGVKTLLIEEFGAHAVEVASHFPEVHVVGVAADFPPTDGSAELLSRVRAGGHLPFRRASFRGCAILGTPTGALLSEVSRVLAPGARLVVDVAAEDTHSKNNSLGAHVLLHQDGVVVAAAPGPR